MVMMEVVAMAFRINSCSCTIECNQWLSLFLLGRFLGMNEEEIELTWIII